MNKVLEIMKMIDHSLLHPGLTDEGLREGCEVADRCHCATVTVKPYAVPLAAELLDGSDVLVGTVAGFPHGNSPTQIKIAETLNVMEAGAQEVDMVVNIGKVLGEDWQYVEEEVAALRDVTGEHGVVLKVIFANDLLPDDSYKIRLCEICSKVKADFVKTSTGYNFVKGEDGKYSYEGATDHDLRLMRAHSDPDVQVKAAGGVGYLEAILRVREIGVTRIGTGHTEEILEDAKAMFGDE